MSRYSKKTLALYGFFASRVTLNIQENSVTGKDKSDISRITILKLLGYSTSLRTVCIYHEALFNDPAMKDIPEVELILPRSDKCLCTVSNPICNLHTATKNGKIPNFV